MFHIQFYTRKHESFLCWNTFGYLIRFLIKETFQEVLEIILSKRLTLVEHYRFFILLSSLQE